MIRVFAASYSPADRGAIERYLSGLADLYVAGTAHRLRDLVQVLPDPSLDVLLLNRDLPGFEDPLAQLRRIRSQAPALPIVYLAPDEPALDPLLRREEHLGPMRLLRGAFSAEELLEALVAVVRLAPVRRCITWMAPHWHHAAVEFVLKVARGLHAETATMPLLVDWELGRSALTTLLLGSDGHMAWPHALETVLADTPVDALRHVVPVDRWAIGLLPGLFSPSRLPSVTVQGLEGLLTTSRSPWVFVLTGPRVHDPAVQAALRASDALSWLVDTDDPVARAWFRRSRSSLHLRPELQETVTPWGHSSAGTEGIEALASPQRNHGRLAAAVVNRLLSTPVSSTHYAARLVADVHPPVHVDEGKGSLP